MDREPLLRLFSAGRGGAEHRQRPGAVSVMQTFWFLLSTIQVAFAAYVFAALVSWRGERLLPAPGKPFSPLPSIVAVILFALAVSAIVRVGDVEFSRYVGTGTMMLVALAVIVLLIWRGRSR